MLEVVCFKWKPASGYRSQYSPATVNTLKRMFARHYSKPHRFNCVTDDATGIDPDVRVIPLWDDFASIPSPHGEKNPSCYRRLKLFSREAAELIGDRILSIDLDTVIVRDVTPLFDRTDDFIICGDTNPRTPYNGSLMLMTAGAREKVWSTFDPRQSPSLSSRAGFFGSDQGWISYCLGRGEKTWTRKDGVYSFRNHLAMHRESLPADARLTIWHGSTDPWAPRAQQISWVREHYV